MKFDEVVPDCAAYAKDFIPLEASPTFFDHLRDETPWRQEHMTFGKDNQVPLPRVVAWYGDPGANYYYSGIHNEPLPWTDTLLELKRKCDAILPESRFNSVLLNYYRDGHDSIGFHVDNERDLVDNSVIATISLGTPRTFVMKSKAGTGEVHKVDVEDGSLLLMYGRCQKEWLHGIPKQADVIGPRISLTFRTVHIK